jgi:RNA:NAD 2'-phosphotransferase (TPT1/KptA family)
MANFNAISHLMVGALRHGNHGAVTDEAGWMPAATLVALPRFVKLGADQQSVQDVIRTAQETF